VCLVGVFGGYVFVCVCVRYVWLWVLLFGFLLRGGSGGVAGVFCECVVVLCLEFECVFVFVLTFELTRCCSFLWWVVLLLIRLFARVHSVVWVGVELLWMRFVVFESKLLARELSSRLSACVVGFLFTPPADAVLCARRLACRLFVLFCSWKVVAIFCGFCVGGLCCDVLDV